MNIDNTANRQINTKLNGRQMAETNRQVNEVNQKFKIQGKKIGQNLGKDSFLKLLVTQLQHQDPTKPMEDRQFIAQMAQFSSLEQMNNMNTHLERMNSQSQSAEAYSLIGKYVNAYNNETGKVINGPVSHVIRQKDNVLLSVEGVEVEMDQVHAVYNNTDDKKSQVIDLSNDPNKKKAFDAYTRNSYNGNNSSK